MKIADIQNKRVKISSHSITVKDERDKTCGVVRDVKLYRELRPAEQMDYFLRPVENYERLFKGVEGWESEEKDTM